MEPIKYMTALCGVVLASLLAVHPQANADDFPSRTVKMISPSGAGGATDVYVRTVSKQLEAQIGETVVVENLPGAGGVIGTFALVQSNPDGHTIGLASNSYVSHHVTSKDPKYRWPDDLILVHQGVRAPEVLVVHSKLPFKTVKDFIDFAKENPGQLKAAHAGQFTVSHILSLLFQNRAGVKFTDVPYKSSPASMQAVWSGEADLVFQQPSSYRAALDAAAVRPIASLDKEPSSYMDGIPTMREAGIDIVYDLWLGFVVPKGTPDETVAHWHTEISQAMKAEEVQKLLQAQGYSTFTGSREGMIDNVNDEIVTLEKLLKDANISPK